MQTTCSRNFFLVVLLFYTKVLLLLPLYSAEKDSNPYPYGNNPNNQFKMYWNDAANVLQDLSKFSALFIKYHGCVWSECHVDQYDDDGENRDGGMYREKLCVFVFAFVILGWIYKNHQFGLFVRVSSIRFSNLNPLTVSRIILAPIFTVSTFYFSILIHR